MDKFSTDLAGGQDEKKDEEITPDLPPDAEEIVEAFETGCLADPYSVINPSFITKSKVVIPFLVFTVLLIRSVGGFIGDRSCLNLFFIVNCFMGMVVCLIFVYGYLGRTRCYLLITPKMLVLKQGDDFSYSFTRLESLGAASVLTAPHLIFFKRRFLVLEGEPGMIIPEEFGNLDRIMDEISKYCDVEFSEEDEEQ